MANHAECSGRVSSIGLAGRWAWLAMAAVGAVSWVRAEAEPSRVMLVADVEWIQPGRPFRVGLLFRMQADWHVYWLNPGDSGAAPRIDWELPEGFEPGVVQWPHPRRFDDPPFATFGHEGDLLLVRDIRAPPRLESGGTVSLTAAVSWVVCKDVCIAQRDRVSLRLDVRDEAPAPSETWRKVFEHAAARVPVVDPGWAFSVAADADTYTLSLTPPKAVGVAAVMAAEFFPAQPGFIRTGPYRWSQDGESARLALVRDGPAPEENRLRGVLVLPDPAGAGRALIVEAALPGGREP